MMLAPGPQRATVIRQAARAAGIADRTLDRAAALAGVQSRKHRGRVDGSWTWEIPERPGALSAGHCVREGLCWNPRCHERFVGAATRYCMHCGWPRVPGVFHWPLITRLARHPDFRVRRLGAAARATLAAAVREHGEGAVTQWLKTHVYPAAIATVVTTCDPTTLTRPRLLDAIDREIETELTGVAPERRAGRRAATAALETAATSTLITTARRAADGTWITQTPAIADACAALTDLAPGTVDHLMTPDLSPHQQVVLRAFAASRRPDEIAALARTTPHAVSQTKHRLKHKFGA
jgi:hypothetical protein